MTVDALIDCRLCGARDYAHLYDVRGWPIGRCRTCGLEQVMVSPDAQVLDEIYGESYFAKGKYCQDVAGQREQERRIAFMQASGLPGGSRVLDLGMATGEFLGAAREHFEVWGVDVAESAVEHARALYPESAARLFAGMAQAAPLPAAYFDAVVMWDVVEHLDDPVSTLHFAASRLRAGGWIFLSTPNAGAWIASLMGARWHFMTPPEHLVYFDRRRLQDLCVRCGYAPQRWMTRGKWVNLGFLLHKLRRVMPGLMPASLQARVAESRFGSLVLYAPTGDIQYLAAQRP